MLKLIGAVAMLFAMTNAGALANAMGPVEDRTPKVSSPNRGNADYRVAGLIEQECSLWSNACRDNCVAKYPRRTGSAGASIGTLPSYSNSQRAALIASCRKDCMAGYPLCK